MTAMWQPIVVNSGSVLGMEEYEDADFRDLVNFKDLDAENAKESMGLLKEVLVEKDELDFEFLLHTDGLEEMLKDPKKVLAFGNHDYLLLHKISVWMGIHATAGEMKAILKGDKPGVKRHTAIDSTKEPDLRNGDEAKSPRRLKKEANWRRKKKKLGLVSAI